MKMTVSFTHIVLISIWIGLFPGLSIENANADNVALGKTATQSSTGHGGVASRGVDGNTAGHYSGNSVTHTNNNPGAWWKVALGSAHALDRITLWNRTDCCANRLSNFYVDYLNAGGGVIATAHHPGTAGRETNIALSGDGVHAVRVRLWDPSQTAGASQHSTPANSDGSAGGTIRVELSNNYLQLQEVEIKMGGSWYYLNNGAFSATLTARDHSSGHWRASRAGDGNLNGPIYHSKTGSGTNWWQASLDNIPHPITHIRIKTRADAYGNRINGAKIKFNGNHIATWRWDGAYTKTFSVTGYHGVAFRSAFSKYVVAEGNGGGTVNANRNSVGSWETFSIINTSGSCPRHNGKVNIMTGGGYYFSAKPNGNLDADRTVAGSWERFTLINHSRSNGCLQSGDRISLKSAHNRYVKATLLGRAYANSRWALSWEKFRVSFQSSFYNGSGIGDGQGNVIYLDRHEPNCGTKGLNQFRLRRPTTTRINYNYKCLDVGDSTVSAWRNTPANDWGNGHTAYLDRHAIDCGDKPLKAFRLTRPSGTQLSYAYKCGGNILHNISDHYTAWASNGNNSGNSIFLDRQNVACPTGKVLTYARLRTDWGNAKYRYHYKCGDRSSNTLSLAEVQAWGVAENKSLTGKVNVDNNAWFYISTSNSTQGTQFGATSRGWGHTHNVGTNLTAGQTYYLHIKAKNSSGPSGLLGEFSLSGGDHEFPNGTNKILTGTSHWRVSRSGWGGYAGVSAYGKNGVGPWGNRGGSGVDSNAYWIWASPNNLNNDYVYFTVKISPVSPYAHYAVQQNAWSSGTVAIDDYTDNNNDGVSVGNAISHEDGYVCRGVFIPNNTNKKTIDAINSQQDINTALGNSGTIMLWYRAQQNWVGSGHRILIDASMKSSGKYFFLEKRDNGSLRFALEDSADKDFNLYTSNYSFTAGTWVHVAITWDLPNQSIKIFVNGAQAASASINSNGVLGNLGAIYFGDSASTYGGPGLSAYGRIDEMRLYKSALSAAGIAAARAETHDCISCTLGSFNITQPANGLACPSSRASIAIEALCDDGTTTKTDYTGTVTLSGPSTSTFYNAASGGSAITNYTFSIADAGEKTVYLYFNNDNANVKTTLTDSAASVSSTAATGTYFRTKGFTMSSIGDVACGNNTSFTLTAYGQTSNGSGQACEVLTGFNGNKALDIWYAVDFDHSAGADTVSTPLSINGSNSNSRSSSVEDNVNASFVNGQASITLNYNNTGSVTVYVEHDTAPYNSNAKKLSGNDTFVAYPAQFAIAASNGASLHNTSASGGATHAAGANFDLQIDAQCASGSAATDYRIGSTTSLAGKAKRTAPTSGASVNGSMKVSTSTQLNATTSPSYSNITLATSAFDNNGSYSFSAANYDEVGLVKLFIRDSNYYGVTNVGASSQNIGRFIPDHFEVTNLNTGSYANACSSGSGSTYNGQAFGFDSSDLPSVTITPVNAAGDATENYIGSYRKLNSASMLSFNGNSNWATTPYSITSANPNSNGAPNYLTLEADLDAGSLTTGGNGYDFSYQLTSTDKFTYYRQAVAKVAPFDASFSLQITDINDGEASGLTSSYTFPASTTAIKQRYGRLNVENAFGPETDALKQAVTTQYWDGSAFSLNTDDDCTAITSGMITTSKGLGQLTGITVGSGSSSLSIDPSFTDGDGNFSYSAPGAGNTGDIAISFNLSTLPWLQFDWDGNGSDDNPPSKTATFGQYRGHDKVLYWREVSY